MKAVRTYARTMVETADPGKLLVMLYDGFLRFAERGRLALEDGDPAAAGLALRRALAIVHELRASLRPEASPELSERLTAIYDFVEEQVMRAHVQKDPAALVGILPIMTGLRDAWSEARQADTTAG